MGKYYHCSNYKMCENTWGKDGGVNEGIKKNLCPKCGQISIEELKKRRDEQ